MLLHAIIICSKVEEVMFYDEKTGAERPSFWINMTVIDDDTCEKYDIQVTDGYTSLSELISLKRKNAPADELRKIADHLRNELPQKFEKLDFKVLRLKGEQAPYLKLECHLIRNTQKDST